jgi:hypothetical protein
VTYARPIHSFILGGALNDVMLVIAEQRMRNKRCFHDPFFRYEFILKSINIILSNSFGIFTS